MLTLDAVRTQIKKLYETNPTVHITVSLTRPKLLIENEEVKIKGVYPHIFQIEEYSTGAPKTHTLQYADVLVRRIIIAELEK